MSLKTLRSIFLGVAAVLGASFAAPTYAAIPVNDIASFITCLNNIPSGSQTVADAAGCVPAPAGVCVYTVTMSQESAQPACTLRDGTKLPRVIFSCPGPGGNLVQRFRPSFTLCPRGADTAGLINHIELGQDINPIAQDGEFRHNQIMADINSPPGSTSFQSIMEFGMGGAVDTISPFPNPKGCDDCHDALGSTSVSGNWVRVFAAIGPDPAEGTIFTNDPSVRPPLGTPITLKDICNGIASSTQLAASPAQLALEVSLCTRLLAAAGP